MTPIKLLQTPYSYECLKSYYKDLSRRLEIARDGKDMTCTKCDENGIVKVPIKSIFGDVDIFNKNEKLIEQECECVRYEKKEIISLIEKTDTLIRKYKIIFGSLDDNMTFDIFSKAFNQEKIISSIKRYLNIGSPFSLFITGKSSSGKTTILKMLWQIYAINNISVYYLKASYFENLYKNLFNKNQLKENIQSRINEIVENAKKSSVLMIDDMDCVGIVSAASGYYDIFDARRAQGLPILIASNKRYKDMLNSYTKKKGIEAAIMAERITSRLLGLKIVEVELFKEELVEEKKNA